MPTENLQVTLNRIKKLRQDVSETNNEVNKLIRTFAKLATESEASLRTTTRYADQLRALKNSVKDLDDTQLQSLDKAIKLLDQDSEKSERALYRIKQAVENLNTTSTATLGKEIDAIGDAATRTNSKMSQVNQAITEMNSMIARIPLGDINTFGRPSSASTGVQAELWNVDQSARDAVRQIQKDYEGWDLKLQDLNTTIDAHTGKVRVQIEAQRKLGETIQKVNAVAYGDPNTGDVTSLYPEQQAFVGAISPFGGPEGESIERAQQALSQYGYTLNDIIGVQKNVTDRTTSFVAIAKDGYTQANFEVDRYGNLLLKTARNSQTLIQNVERNISKVIEWSIATGLVYGVVASIPQAAEGMKEIEQTFADIAVATGASEEALQRYYDTSLRVATLTGTDVTNALQAHQKALRATSNLSNQASVSTQLLADSMGLAQLAGIDQAQALDTLLGSLRQTGLELDQGQTLLDKWVRVSRQSGASIEDMAESFAITASAADTAGVTFDTLNGLVAVLAESTSLSATEIGNALRTMMSNITAPEAITQLQRFGISVREVNGDLRSWTDITQNIIDLMNAGVLNQEQLNTLANALGGGSRRGPQLLAIWQNYARVNQLAEESASANGDAADAMARKMETLQKATQDLNNALDDLVQSLGFEGGFLDLMKSGVELMTDMVRILSDVTDSLGSSSSAMTTALLAYGGLTKLTGGGGFITGNVFAASGNPALQKVFGTDPYGVQGFGAPQAALQGLTGPALAIIGSEIVRGITGEQNAWGRVGGSIAGALVGNMILPGAGGLIGSIIANSFVATFQAQRESVLALGGVENTQSAEEIQTALEGILLGGVFGGGRVGASIRGSTEEDLGLEGIAEIIRDNVAEIRALKAGTGPVSLAGGQLAGQLSGGEFTPEEEVIAAASILSEEKLQELLVAIDLWNDAKEREANELSEASRLINTPQVAMDIAALAQSGLGVSLGENLDDRQSNIFEESMISGDLSGYNEFVQSAETVKNILPQLAVALDEVNISQEDYIRYGDLLVSTTEEARGKIIQYMSNINNLKSEIERIQTEGTGGLSDASIIAEANAQLDEQQGLLRDNLALIERQVGVQRARDTYFGPTDAPEGITPDLVQQALPEIRRQQDQFARALGIDPEVMKEALAQPLIFAYEDGFGEIIEGLVPAFQQRLTSALSETSDQMRNQMAFTFRDLSDLDVGQSRELQRRINYYDAQLRQQFGDLGFDEESQNIGVRFEGNQFRSLYGTATAMQLALEEILEVEKDQLEGFWNLPSGVTAYVPITSLFGTSQPQASGTNYDLSGIESPVQGTENILNSELPKQTTLLSTIAGRTGLSDTDYSAREILNRDFDNRPAPWQNRVEERRFDLNLIVRNEPQDISINLDGRQIANSISDRFSRQFRQQIRTAGLKSGIVMR